MTIIYYCYDIIMINTIEETIIFAKNAHSKTNALDKTGKIPYYWHLLRVMLRLKNVSMECQQVCLLHDVLEDTAITYEELKENFGQNIADKVKWCSKNYFPTLSFNDWMSKIAHEAPEDVILVKLADISDNLSFERMKGLMPSKQESFLKNKPETIQERIKRTTNKRMKLRGEMGVYDRYYKGWNLILENKKNLDFLPQVFTEDFVNYEQLHQLCQYIEKNEYNDYLKLNKIHTWKISAHIETHYDKNGTPYLAAKVNESIGRVYQSFLEQTTSLDFIENQKKRDKNQFHVTLVNAMEYGLLKKRNELEKLNILLDNPCIDFYSYGIGRAEKKEDCAYYVILENETIQTFRKNLNLKPNFLHMTLGFKEKDVHGVSKDRKSKIIDNQNIWKFLIDVGFGLAPSTVKHIKKNF